MFCLSGVRVGVRLSRVICHQSQVIDAANLARCDQASIQRLLASGLKALALASLRCSSFSPSAG